MDDPNALTSSRRDVLHQRAGGAALVGSGAMLAPAAQAAAGPRSGLLWSSGATINQWSTFATWRKRPLDTITCWVIHNTWTDIASIKGGFSTARNSGARVSCAIRLLPKSHDGNTTPANWKNAASGLYDTYYKQFATKLALSGVTNVICRIGWETNDKSRPDFCGTDRISFIATWRRIAGILRTTMTQYNRTILLEWNNIKKGAQSDNIMNYYPGDDVVDIIGVNYYDGWPPLSTQAIWDSKYMAEAKGKGGPWGIGRWCAEARTRNKLFSCSEWGVNNGRYTCTDNPLYIENMHEFFTTNVDIIAYENYFNQKRYHQLTPSDINPNSSKKYMELWGG